MFAGSPAPIQTLVPVVTLTDQQPGAGQLAGAALSDSQSGGARFAAALAAMTDGVAGAVNAADHSAALLAAGKGDVEAAAIARAKADVALEIASVAASRVSAAMTALLQTQS
ncbi:MAG TPA: flagellar hook-basal body complex protein FliE [Candidatus Eremiobacteraceae bacterium]|jgi:flagellar hook-basal body complex protein FliE